MTDQSSILAFLSPLAEGVRIGSSQESSASLIQAQAVPVPIDPLIPPGGQFSIPTPNICSWNVTSLSYYTRAQNKVDHLKRQKQIKTLSYLAKSYPIVCLQETKLSAKETIALAENLPNHRIFYSNNPSNTKKSLSKFKAGILTIVNKGYADRFTITHSEPIPGYLQHLCFKDSTGEWPDFDIVNIYMEKDRASVFFNSIGDLSFSPSGYRFLLGDFNFIEAGIDTTADAPKYLPESTRNQWTGLLSQLRLKEVHQDDHTYFHMSKGTVRSSRIDRIYASLSEADWELSNPSPRVHPPCNADINSLSQHMPLGLRFTPREKNCRGPRIPDWVVQDDRYISMVADQWKIHPKVKCPFNNLRNLKNLGLKLVSKFIRRYKPDGGWFMHLQRTKKAHRLLAAKLNVNNRHEYATQLAQSLPDVQAALKDKGFDSAYHAPRHTLISTLSEVIDGIYEEHGIPDHRDLHLPQNKPNQLRELKLILPSTRSSLTTIVEDDTLHTTPQTVGESLSRYWSKVWAAGQESQGHDLSDYNQLVDPSLNPPMLKVSAIEDSILDTGNSSPGPDGIPFAFYRKLARITRKLLFRIYIKLARGQATDYQLRDFNRSNLIAIPKGDSGKVEDTRPICINNTDNRIIAKAITMSITPATDAILHPSQKLFVKGRIMTEHITTLSDRLYDRDPGLFALFLDTRKAFDSVHHSFIYKVLATQGWPPWLLTSVKSLLTDVTCHPIQWNKGSPIEIQRGVKQGCPLSPILFVLCYDVMIRALQSDEFPRETLGAADDLVVLSPTLDSLLTSLPIIDSFAAQSGLGINKGKTAILPPTNLNSGDMEVIRSSPWPDLQVVTKYKYLGIYFSRVGENFLENVWDPPLTKTLKRLESYNSILRNMPLRKRVMTVNTFVLPLLYYHAQFLMIPKGVYTTVQTAIQRAVVPYHGTAFKYSFLIQPKSYFGLDPPLKDIWAMANKLLLSRYDFLTHQDTEWINEDELSISKLKSFVATDFLKRYSSTTNPGMVNKDNLYLDLVAGGYGQVHRSEWFRKLGRFNKYNLETPSNLDGNKVISFAPYLAKSPAFLKDFTLRLLTNALPTDCRNRIPFKLQPRSQDPLNPFPCRLCGKREDRIEHYFLNCEVTTLAMRNLGSMVFSHSLQATLESPRQILFLCQTPWRRSEGNFPAFLFTLCWSVWKISQTIRKGIAIRNPEDKITELVLSEKRCWDPPLTKKKSRSAYQEIIEQIPDTDIVCYTDGSANPNPGPTGAGALILLRSEQSNISLTAPLGNGTNNLGELWAIGMTVKWLIDNNKDDVTTHIFTDSSYSKGVLTEGWNPKTNRDLIHEIKNRIEEFRSNIIFHWVKGHANIEGNEAADKAAETGSSLSRTHPDRSFSLRDNSLGYYLLPLNL